MPEQEHRWPCSSCGAELRFVPGQTQLACPYCGHVQAIPQNPGARRDALGELDLDAALRNALPPAQMEEVRTTPCPSCGALIEFHGATHATECPFCATPVVTGTGTQRMIKPQALVPFRLTEREARGAMTQWLGNLWFAPSGLVQYARKGRAMTGMYVPYWTFDARTASRYSGQRGDAYYETQTVTVNVNGRPQRRQQQVRKIRWHTVTGQVARHFDDVLVMASQSLPARLGDELTPWDLGALEPYSPDYLAGFQSEGYTIGLAEGGARARAVMARVIEMDVRRSIGGDEQRVGQIETRHSAETFKHILLPVWMAAYKYNGRSYRFLVNGQTGEVQGERPWSVWKILFAVLLALALLAGFAALNESGAFDQIGVQVY